MPEASAGIRETVREAAHPVLWVRDVGYTILDLIGNARVALLGEATHGTHQTCRERARITRRRIEEIGFTTVAAAADSPEACRVNR